MVGDALEQEEWDEFPRSVLSERQFMVVME